MTLTAAIRTATSALAANAKHVSILSKNISSAGDPNYIRRSPTVISQLQGAVRVETQRYVNQATYDASVLAAASSAGANVIAKGIDRYAALQGLDDFSFSPANLLADLRQATELAAASPSDVSTLSSLIEQGRNTANSLNRLYEEVLAIRTNADKGLSDSVANINSLLGQLKSVNDQVVAGTRMGDDVFDSLDARDQLLTKLSDEIGIKVIPRESNDILVMADNGLLLFEKTPRNVSFQQTPSFGPGTTGNTLFIDGVAISGGNVSMPLNAGRIAGNLELRDGVFLEQQNQLDEIARSLIELFAETDQSVAGTKPGSVGLFTWSGGPGIPASATLEPGIGLSIRINPAIDGSAGGDPSLLRDGGANGDTDYVYNTTGGPGFSDRLYALSTAFNTQVNFDPALGLPDSQSVLEYSAASLDWMNANRQSATDVNRYKSELTFRYQQTLQNESGTNIDAEMLQLLEVERAYQASARLLSAVDEMFSTLLNSVR